jgi:formyl-CoA transferase
MAEPAFANDTLRVRNREALVERIEAMTALEPRDRWLARFEAARIPCGPINDYAETFADPQVRERGMVVDVDHPTLGRLRTLGSPVKMSATPPVVDRRAPLLGEHTRETLREAGCSEDEIRAVMMEGGLAV